MKKSNNRFAWLTPVGGHGKNQGPWILAENGTQRFAHDGSTAYRRISINGLLQFASGVLDIPVSTDHERKRVTWQSPCNRYRVEWQRDDGDGKRLFLQRRDDHFARIEIWLDDTLLVAFKEPVWLHLRKQSERTIDRLMIPSDLLIALESGSLRTRESTASIRQGLKHAATRAA